MSGVLQINSVCGTGSTGRIAVGIQNALRATGSPNWIAHGRGNAASVPDTLRIGDLSSLIFHGAMTRLLDRHGLGSRRATRAFVRRVSALSPDIIHLHNIHGYFLNFEVLFDFLKTAGVPVVWTLHDCWPFTGHCSHYDYIGCAKWRTACFRCPQTEQYPASWAVDASEPMFARKRRAFSGVERMTLVTPSEWLANQVKTSFLEAYPLTCIPNGIDLNSFKPTPSPRVRMRFGIPPDTDIVLGVAADFREPRKGLRYFLEMAPHLPDGAVIVLVGVPRGAARNLPRNVVAIPRTESVGDLAALYSASTVFVDPTLEDTFPTVILEALACGTPVVTFATGGCPEQVTADTGIVVQKGDLGALIAGTMLILERGKQSYGSACVARARRYSATTMASAYLRLYGALVDSEGGTIRTSGRT